MPTDPLHDVDLQLRTTGTWVESILAAGVTGTPPAVYVDEVQPADAPAPFVLIEAVPGGRAQRSPQGGYNRATLIVQVSILARTVAERNAIGTKVRSGITGLTSQGVPTHDPGVTPEGLRLEDRESWADWMPVLTGGLPQASETFTLTWTR